MAWIKLLYPNDIKIHYVHSDVEDVVIRDIKERYDVEPVEKEKISYLSVDPGGMICLDNAPVKKTIQDLQINIQPEHIIRAAYRWTRNRKVDEGVYKIYMSSLSVIVVPELFYNKIGAWLALNKGVGYVAEAERVERLSDLSSYIVMPLEGAGDS